VSEQTEEEYLIERLSKLLAEISVIVNGPQPMGVLWSYADLPQKVQALKDAAALNAQDAERNRADLLAEDIEAFHLALDKHGVPRADEAGAVFSMYGRALRLNQQAGVVEALLREAFSHGNQRGHERTVESYWNADIDDDFAEWVRDTPAALAAIGGKP
jgi:hypothetical protein